MDETTANVAVEIPRNSQAEQEPPAVVENQTSPVLDRPRREVCAPIWIRGFVP